MFIKILTISLIFSLAISYQKNDNILILSSNDFPKVIDQHEFIFIFFNAPWCKYCKSISPIYKQISDQLSSKQLEIKFAEIQSSKQNQNISIFYNIDRFPQFLLFINGTRIDYEGQRTKQHMTKWLQKITIDPLNPLSKQHYQTFPQTDRVRVVFHGSLDSQQAKILRNYAYTNDKIDYYITNVGKKQGQLLLSNPVGQPMIYQKVDRYLQLWINHNQRPLTVPFTDKTIHKMIRQNKITVCLLNQNQSQNLYKAFTQAAKQSLRKGYQIIFTIVQKSGQHFTRFSYYYLKINTSKIAIVLVDRADESKFVLIKNPQTVTANDIIEFIQGWKNKTIKRYLIPDKIWQLEEAQNQVKSQNNQKDINQISNQQKNIQQPTIDSKIQQSNQPNQNLQQSSSNTNQL